MTILKKLYSTEELGDRFDMDFIIGVLPIYTHRKNKICCGNKVSKMRRMIDQFGFANVRVLNGSKRARPAVDRKISRANGDIANCFKKLRKISKESLY